MKESVSPLFDLDRRVFLGGHAELGRNRDGKWKDEHHSYFFLIGGTRIGNSRLARQMRNNCDGLEVPSRQSPLLNRRGH